LIVEGGGEGEGVDWYFLIHYEGGGGVWVGLINLILIKIN
jgi:hypothetical protein